MGARSRGLVFLLLAATACVREVKLRPITDSAWFQRESRTALESGSVSERTRQYLRRAGLLDDYEGDAAATLQALHDRLLRERDRETAFHLAELCYQRARDSGPREAARHDLSAARYAYAYLFDPGLGPAPSGFDPLHRWACDFYNRSVARVISFAREQFRAAAGSGVASLRLPVLAGEIDIRKGASEYAWDPRDDNRVVIAFHYEVVGLPGSSRSYGLGVPLIVVRSTAEEGTLVQPPILAKLSGTPLQSLDMRQTYAATALLRFEGSILESPGSPSSASFEVYDPSRTVQVQIEGREVPLETDLTSPLAYALSQSEGYSGLRGLLHVEESQQAVSLMMLQRYDPEKIPVVFVHGLLSNPRTWVYLFNDLLADPELRLRYQFWFFRYPTGNPILLSASLLRETLLEVARSRDPEGTSPAFQNMVVCGHSMGGLLTKLLVLDGGDRLWNELSDRPLAELDLSEEDRDVLHHVTYFQRLPFVKRVVFMATPHRGAGMATGFVGRLGARLVNLPRTVLQVTRDLGTALGRGMGLDVEENTMTGIGGLAPDSFLATKLSTWPLPEDLPVHSIIGNKAAANTPGGTDGIVSYESSHLDGVESELILKSKHDVQIHPEATQELRRILYEHLRAFDAAAAGATGD